MKNKKMVFVLIPLVVLVWAAIVYQVSGFIDDEPQLVHFEAADTVDMAEINRDTFQIVADYRDPFLGRVSRAATQSTAATPTKKKPVKKKEKKVVHVPWPTVEYGGMIGSGSGSHVAMIKINNREKLMTEGVEVDGLTLKKIFRDSVTVVFMEQEKTISK